MKIVTSANLYNSTTFGTTKISARSELSLKGFAQFDVEGDSPLEAMKELKAKTEKLRNQLKQDLSNIDSLIQREVSHMRQIPIGMAPLHSTAYLDGEFITVGRTNEKTDLVAISIKNGGDKEVGVATVVGVM